MLKNTSVVSISDIGNDDLFELFKLADSYSRSLEQGKKFELLKGNIMATFFYEPSTRTRLSFESAMQRLGGSVISVSEAKSSSVAKGETLADTVRMAASYSDLIVIRHPMDGAARLARRFSSKPIINAGDGSGQHPTQTLLDLFTIKKELSGIDGKVITMLGDLRYGRTVHSLLLALSNFDVRVNLVSPPLLRVPQHILDLASSKIRIRVTENLNEVLGETDVLYVTRIQKERFTDESEYNSVIGYYIVNSDIVSTLKKQSIIMHPLPRVNEISPEVDADPRAAYFRQAANGIPVRMALLSMILEGR